MVRGQYGEGYYAESAVDDPTGPDSGLSRVLRGGSWHDGPTAPAGEPRLLHARLRDCAHPGVPCQELSNVMASGRVRDMVQNG